MAQISVSASVLASILLVGDTGQKSSRNQTVVEEQVRFRHGNDVLAATLYKPGAMGRHPAVALVLGSGAQARDYGGTGPALGRHFARHGLACLAWDKPGVGQSTGDFNKQTLSDRADETLAAVAFLRARADMRANQVGV